MSAIVIDGAAMHRHEQLKRKYIASSVLCVAIGICEEIVIAFSRTEIADENSITSDIESVCSEIHGVYKAVADQLIDKYAEDLYVNAKLSELTGLYGISRYALNNTCRSITKVSARGVKMDQWSDVVDRAFSQYLDRCIPRTLRSVKKFRDTLAGDFENWLRKAIDELCRRGVERVLVLTHDDGVEEYGKSICECYAKYIKCRLEVKVVRDSCENSCADLLIKMIN